MPYTKAQRGRTPRTINAADAVAANTVTIDLAQIEQEEQIIAPEPAPVMEPVQIMEEPAPVATPEPIVQNIILKTDPVREAVVKVLSVDDTPYLRAEKIQAMADAAKAHARLHDLGVMNNDFLLMNAPVVAIAPTAKPVARTKTSATVATLVEEQLNPEKSLLVVKPTKKTKLVAGIVGATLVTAGLVSVFFVWVFPNL